MIDKDLLPGEVLPQPIEDETEVEELEEEEFLTGEEA